MNDPLMEQCRKEAEAYNLSGLEKEMTQAMYDLLGGGYIGEYYRQNASDFIAIAKSVASEAYAAALYAERSKPPVAREVVEFHAGESADGEFLVWHASDPDNAVAAIFPGEHREALLAVLSTPKPLSKYMGE